jgi:hypothetical protein
MAKSTNGDPPTWQRPPFERGHTASVVHGAWSERRVGPLTEQIAADLLADADTPAHLREPVFAAAVRGWARAEAMCQLLAQFLDGQSIEQALTEVTTEEQTEEREGKSAKRMTRGRRVASVLDASRRWEAHAANLRGKLGLDPVSAARVSKDLATSRYLDNATPLAQSLDQIAARRAKALGSGAADGG